MGCLDYDKVKDHMCMHSNYIIASCSTIYRTWSMIIYKKNSKFYTAPMSLTAKLLPSSEKKKYAKRSIITWSPPNLVLYWGFIRQAPKHKPAEAGIIRKK